MTNKFKRTVLVAAVLCAMPTGYRRAGFALAQGENSLEVNQEQFDKLTADKNLTVTVVDADSVQSEVDTKSDDEHYDNPDIAYLKDQNTTLKGEVISLSNELANVKKQLAAAQVVNHEDTLTDLAGGTTTINELDVSSAPKELHHWIAVIDDLNKEAPLTKKPNCDHLTITVEGEELTPTGAERDAAWAWYQDNIITASTDANVNTRETGE